MSEDRPGFITVPPGLGIPQPAPQEDHAEHIAPPAESATYRLPIDRAIPAVARPAIPTPSFPPGVQPIAADPVLGDTVITRTTARTTWRLDLPSGLPSVTVTGPAVLGRSPSAVPSARDAVLVRLEDPTKSVSKTHALLETEGDVLWVTDLDSTNGVVVVSGTGEQATPAPGERARVADGSILVLGDLEITVARR